MSLNQSFEYPEEVMPESNSTLALAPDSHSARMLACLKDVLQARHMRYSDVAALMGVSEKSIKRYMCGKGVTLPILEQLCAAAGINLGELSEIAGATDKKERPWTTESQEAVLAAEPRLAIIVALLSSGWTGDRIAREGLCTLSELNAILVRLDHLGVITLHPGNRTTLRVKIRRIDTASEPLRKVITLAGKRVLQNLDLADPRTHWRLNYARLGPASVERVVQRLNVFLEEVAELSRQDMDLGGDQVKWHAVCGIITEHEVLGLKQLKEVQAGS